MLRQGVKSKTAYTIIQQKCVGAVMMENAGKTQKNDDL